jgi:hypothetical protein
MQVLQGLCRSFTAEYAEACPERSRRDAGDFIVSSALSAASAVK